MRAVCPFALIFCLSCLSPVDLPVCRFSSLNLFFSSLSPEALEPSKIFGQAPCLCRFFFNLDIRELNVEAQLSAELVPADLPVLEICRLARASTESGSYSACGGCLSACLSARPSHVFQLPPVRFCSTGFVLVVHLTKPCFLVRRNRAVSRSTLALSRYHLRLHSDFGLPVSPLSHTSFPSSALPSSTSPHKQSLPLHHPFRPIIFVQVRHLSPSFFRFATIIKIPLPSPFVSVL